MRAMVLREPMTPLVPAAVPPPAAGEGQVLLRVQACAVCRTDLHIVDGDLKNPKLPLIPGHQIVGVDQRTGRSFGVPWLGWTCGRCAFCSRGRENLCDNALFTGYAVDGGYAEYVVADERYCFPIPDGYSAEEAAPLLCAGLIGFRAYRFAGDARRIGLYGFGSAAQIVAQLAVAEGHEVFAVTRPGDEAAQSLAREMGASTEKTDELDAAIVFAPVGELVVTALKALRRGGDVICAGIHMTDIPSFPYELLWGERSIRSVANLTRRDGVDLFARLSSLRIRTTRTRYALENANEALADLRSSALTGTAVLVP